MSSAERARGDVIPNTPPEEIVPGRGQQASPPCYIILVMFDILFMH